MWDDAQICGLRNSAPVRAPTRRADGSVNLEGTRRDVATALSRMKGSEYDVLVVPQSLQKLAYSKEWDSSFGEMLRGVIQEDHHSAPQPTTHSMHNYEPNLLVKEHHARVGTPDYKPTLLVLMAGVGCDALAALASQFDIKYLVDCCPHAVEELHLQFPKSLHPDLQIIRGDITKVHIRRMIGHFRVDAVLMGIPCQASSDADPHLKADDPRPELGPLY